MSELVLVARLKQCYWPTWVHGWTVVRVRAAKPKPRYKRSKRNERWDLGRVHHFVQLLERGDPIEPISIESNVYGRGSNPPSWGPPFIDDGHHRFVAAVLAKQETIPASFGGLVTTLDWLIGKCESPPSEITG